MNEPYPLGARPNLRSRCRRRWRRRRKRRGAAPRSVEALGLFLLKDRDDDQWDDPEHEAEDRPQYLAAPLALGDEPTRHGAHHRSGQVERRADAIAGRRRLGGRCGHEETDADRRGRYDERSLAHHSHVIPPECPRPTALPAAVPGCRSESEITARTAGATSVPSSSIDFMIFACGMEPTVNCTKNRS